MTASAIDIQAVQRVRKVAVGLALLALVGLALVAQSIGGVDGTWHEQVELVGFGAIAVSIIGRAWCSLYIGGRKKTEIVDRGPYSVSRNPLYLFSFIGAFGIGAQSGSLVIAGLFVLAAVTVFSLTIRREEAYLRDEFGAAYEAYCARTPRFGPDFRLWRDEGELVVRPAFFLLTIRDGLVFLLALPIFELIDAGQAEGWLRVLVHLP